MTLGITPITKPAYTKKGNEYTESNVGKFAAVTLIDAGAAAGATIYGIKKIKKIESPKFKTICNNVVDYMKDFRSNAKGSFNRTVEKFCSVVHDYPTRTVAAYTAASVLLATAAILTIGTATDAIVNKVRAKKADRDAEE